MEPLLKISFLMLSLNELKLDMKKILLVANWKCNPSTAKEAKNLFGAIKKGIGNITKVEIVICPPFLYLPFLNKLAKNSRILLGAQNVFLKEGPFTGEVSPKMLKDAGVKYVIIGHSERRALGEDDKLINQKIVASLNAKLKVIFCVGENISEKKKGQGFLFIEKQIVQGLYKVKGALLKNLIVAYEPVWAISKYGLGPCKVNDIMSANLFIRKIIAKLYSKKIASQLKILYGGSINSSNAKALVKDTGVDGALVGKASLTPAEFLSIEKVLENRS